MNSVATVLAIADDHKRKQLIGLTLHSPLS